MGVAWPKVFQERARATVCGPEPAPDPRTILLDLPQDYLNHMLGEGGGENRGKATQAFSRETEKTLIWSYLQMISDTEKKEGMSDLSQYQMTESCLFAIIRKPSGLCEHNFSLVETIWSNVAIIWVVTKSSLDRPPLKKPSICIIFNCYLHYHKGIILCFTEFYKLVCTFHG